MVTEFEGENPALYADWFSRMLRSDNLDLAILGAESTHIMDAFEDFVRDRIGSERPFPATDAQVRALDSVRRAFLDVDVIVDARRVQGRTQTRFRDIATGRFVGLRAIIRRLTGEE